MRYTADPLALDLCRPPPSLPHPCLRDVRTPLVAPAWEAALAAHPDRAFARYIVAGIKQGFRIGFRRGDSLRSASRNMLSALEHPEVVQSYLEKECSFARMLGPFPTSALHSAISIGSELSRRGGTQASGA